MNRSDRIQMLPESAVTETLANGTTVTKTVNACGVTNMIQYDVANKKIWLFGDYTGFSFERTAQFDGLTNTFSEAVKLPEPLEKPCVVQVDADTILVIGGRSADDSLKGQVRHVLQ